MKAGIRMFDMSTLVDLDLCMGTYMQIYIYILSRTGMGPDRGGSAETLDIVAASCYQAHDASKELRHHPVRNIQVYICVCLLCLDL